MLYREHCTIHGPTGYMVKDLTRLGRKIENVIIVDNSPNSYYFQPENALPSLSWIKDKQDYELRDMMPFLKKLSTSNVSDIRFYLEKVIDVTEGSKTPVFNRRKASQLMKLMDSEKPDQTEYRKKPKTSLREEIIKAQEAAIQKKEDEES